MSNIGLKITDSYCNGFGGRRYDLDNSIIEAEGIDWIVIRIEGYDSVHLNLKGYDKQYYINKWTTNLNYKDE